MEEAEEGRRVSSHAHFGHGYRDQTAIHGNNFAFNVTVTASGATPTGQVQLFDGGAALGLPAAVSNGTVSINTGLTAVGTHAVSAHYLGDTTNFAVLQRSPGVDGDRQYYVAAHHHSNRISQRQPDHSVASSIITFAKLIKKRLRRSPELFNPCRHFAR